MLKLIDILVLTSRHDSTNDKGMTLCGEIAEDSASFNTPTTFNCSDVNCSNCPLSFSGSLLKELNPSD